MKFIKIFFQELYPTWSLCHPAESYVKLLYLIVRSLFVNLGLKFLRKWSVQTSHPNPIPTPASRFNLTENRSQKERFVGIKKTRRGLLGTRNSVPFSSVLFLRTGLLWIWSPVRDLANRCIMMIAKLLLSGTGRKLNLVERFKCYWNYTLKKVFCL